MKIKNENPNICGTSRLLVKVGSPFAILDQPYASIGPTSRVCWTCMNLKMTQMKISDAFLQHFFSIKPLLHLLNSECSYFCCIVVYQCLFLVLLF